MEQIIFGGIFMSDKKLMIKSVSVGALCGLACSVAVMCVFALAMLKTGLLSESALNYITAGFLGLGAIVGGFAAAKLNRGAGLIVGALTGAVMIFALVIVSALQNRADFSPLFFIKLLSAAAGGSLGGILAVREKKGY